MKYALINGEKTEATKGSKGFCPSCGSELVAKCGDTNVNHWAHKGSRNCDPWWETETDWHRSWKDNFPKEWQEIIHTDEVSGEKHIADVKTNSNWVLEFQHSHINPEERVSRNSFYPKLVWVIDGVRRQRDKPNFHRILEEFFLTSEDPRFKRIFGQDDCRLIEEWHKSDALVFLDFQDVDKENQPIIWFLFPQIANEAYLWPITRAKFIELHRNNKFDEVVEKTISPFIAKLIKMEEFRRHEREEAEALRKQLAEKQKNEEALRAKRLESKEIRVKRLLNPDNQRNMKSTWEREFVNTELWKITEKWMKLTPETVPNYFKKDIEGDIVFACDKRIWQSRLFNYFISNPKRKL